MAAMKRNELFVYQAVKSGELEIDHLGRVWRTKKRTNNRWSGEVRTTACKRVRAEAANAAGYLQVRLMRNGKRVHAAAHRLVWLHFRGEIPDGLTINHLNGIKGDNRPENLELATYSRQRKHAIRELGAKHWDCRGSNHPKTKLTEADVVEIRSRRRSGDRIKDIAADYGMRSRAVSAICRRRTWRHVN